MLQSQSQLPTKAHSERQQLIPQALGSLPARWETQMEFFGVVHFRKWQAFKQSANEWKILLFPSPFFLNKISDLKKIDK